MIPLILVAGRAIAAPSVSPLPRPPQIGAYDAAARQLGVQEWGSARQSAGLTHVLLRLDGRRAILTVALPASTSPTTADRWLQGVSDELGWADVDLYSSSQPGGVFVQIRAAEVGRMTSPGRRRFDLPAGLLQKRIAALARGPVWLAVRSAAPEVGTAVLIPAARGRFGGSEYLFYRLDRVSAPAISIEYGVSRRWMAAAVTTLLLWLIFPVFALFGAREHLRRQSRVPAMDRLRAFRRWQFGISTVWVFGLIGVPFLLGLEQLTYISGSGGPGNVFRTPPLFFVYLVFGGLSLPARLIGLPLEREARPEHREIPWYRLARGEMILTAAFVAIIVLVNTLTAFLSSRPTALGGSTVAAGIGGVALLIGAGLLWEARVWRDRKQGKRPNEPDAPEPLTGAVREFTTVLGAPVQRTLLLPAKASASLLPIIMVRNGVAVVSEAVVRELDAEQVGALIAAQSLALPRTRKDRLAQWALAASGLGLALGLAPALLMTSGGNSRAAAGPLLGVLMVGTPLVLTALFAFARGVQRRQQEADFRVAEALPEPRRFMDALRKVAEMQFTAQSLRANMQDPSRNERLVQLQRRLGLD